MKVTRAAIVFISILIITCACCIIFFCTPVGPLVAIGLEDAMVKRDIDNPHVNNNFRDWKGVSIDGVGAFSIPEDWSLTECNGIYKIVDASNQIWAYGALFSDNHTEFSSYKEFIETIMLTPLADISLEPFTQAYMMNGSDIDKLIAYNNDASQSYYLIQLFVGTQSEFVWVLTTDLTVDESQFDIAEALLYSYAFQTPK